MSKQDDSAVATKKDFRLLMNMLEAIVKELLLSRVEIKKALKAEFRKFEEHMRHGLVIAVNNFRDETMKARVKRVVESLP